ncbi:MAG: TonB-dependent receptor [Gemmatimonadales bacterium]|nr:MAG: TonB-dependent receptor [Gemmatimonadales bacterium]
MAEYRSVVRVGRSVVMPLICLATIFLVAEPASTQSIQGDLNGRALSATSEQPIQGVVLTLVGQGRERSSLSDAQGRFRFSNLESGEYVLTASYTGVADESLRVAVVGGETTEIEIFFSDEAIELAGIQVTGIREGQAALLRQRNAPNITTQIATSAHGHMPDGNLGTVMKRLPGVSPTYDFGEVTNISIRGIDPNRNAVTVDGARMPSTGSGPGGRGTRIDQLPGEFIRTIEVVKAPTPDMDADAIGGSANLVPKSGLDFGRRTMGGTLGANYSVQREFAEPAGTLYLADTFGSEGRWGLVGILSHSISRAPGDIVQQRSRRGSGQEDFLVTEGPERITSFRIHDDVKERARTNLSVRLDHERSPATRFFLNSFFNYFDEEETMRRSESYGFTEPEQFGGVFPAFPGLAFAGQPLYNPEYMDDPNVQESIYQQHRPSVRFRNPRSRTLHVQPGFRTERGPWEIDSQASVSRTWNRRETLHTYLMLAPDPANGFGIGESAWRIEQEGNSSFPRFTQIGGPDAFDIDNYNIQRHVFEDRRGRDGLYGFSLNLRRALETSSPSALQAGVRFRGQRASWDQTGVRFEDGLTDFFGFDLPLTSAYRGATRDVLDTSYRYDPVGGRYAQFPWPDPRAAERSRRQNPELWIEVPDDDLAASALGLNQSDVALSEDIGAGYLSGEVTVGSLRILGGVRVERTAVSGRGVLDDPSAETLEERFAQRIRSSRSYTNVLPGVHLRWEPRRDLLLRGSVTRTLARPSFGSILPQTEIVTFEGGLGESEVPGLIAQNNVGLRPQVSDNVDLSLEYYFGPRSAISVGAFQKDIENFITQSDELLGPGNAFGPEFVGYQFRTQVNANSARVRGVEFSWQQPFEFLPGGWSGLGGFANGTYLWTRGDYADGAERGNVPGFTPRSANVGLSYETSRFVGRVGINHKGETLTGWNPNRFIKRRFDQAFTMTDVNVEARLAGGVTAYLDIRNLFDREFVNMKAPRTRPYQAEAYGMRINLGLRAVR